VRRGPGRRYSHENPPTLDEVSERRAASGMASHREMCARALEKFAGMAAPGKKLLASSS